MDPFSFWLLLAMVFVTGMLTRVYVLAAVALMLGLIGGLALWWNRRALHGVSYSRRLSYRRGFPGETTHLRLEVENRKLLPVSWLRVQDGWPLAVAPEDDSLIVPTENRGRGLLINLFSLRWFERARRSYPLRLRQRGVYALGPARLESGDFFGLFETTRVLELPQTLAVFPEPLAFARLGLPAEDPFGDRRTARRLYEDPIQPVGIRAYQPEDDFRRVHWPATARTGELQVKVYQPVSARVLVVCLNVSTLAHYWEGVIPELLEYLIRVSAALVQRGLEDGYRVGLASNGSLAHADHSFRVPPGRSPDQLAHLLETLAGVTPFVTAPFERFLAAEAARLPYGATLVIVTALTSPLLAETLLRFPRYGHRVTVLHFGRAEPEPIPGVRLIHLPHEV